MRKLVTNLFGVTPRRTVDPMEAVAVGAAIQAGVLSGELTGVRVRQAWQAELGRIAEQWFGEGGNEGSGDASESDAEASLQAQEEEEAMALYVQQESKRAATKLF